MKIFFVSKIRFFILLSFLLTSNLHSQGPFIVTGVPLESGMFALFTSVLGTLFLYEGGDYAGVKIDLNKGVYLDPQRGPNWWEYFFEPINIGNERAQKYYFNADEIRILWVWGFQLSRERSYELIQKYVHVKKHIQMEVDEFCEKNFINSFVIGIHHRGTDKITEAAIVSFEKTFNTLNSIISNLSEADSNSLKIYVATDDENFLNQLLDAFPTLTIVYNDFIRSKDGTPLHYAQSDYANNYEKGREALLDCLLLSRCNILLRPTSSTLSLMSARFNPNIPVISLD